MEHVDRRFRRDRCEHLLLNLFSLAAGYLAGRLQGLDRRETITMAFHASIHNALLAIYVAMAVLNDPVVALPAAVYSITMNVVGMSFGCWLKVNSRRSDSIRRIRSKFAE